MAAAQEKDEGHQESYTDAPTGGLKAFPECQTPLVPEHALEMTLEAVRTLKGSHSDG